MALSNYATIAWDENGEPCSGKIEAEGTVIDIYKDWLYVHDEKAWRENSGFGRYTIMEISEGQLRYNGFKIITKRGSNEELFVVVEYNNSYSSSLGKEEEEERKQLFGIACYAYDGDDYVGVSEKTKKEFFDWIKDTKEDWLYHIDVCLEKIKDFNTINQGDAYLAKEMGIETPINTHEPILSKILKSEYPYGECPDCHEPIPDNIVDGEECPNCGHVFRRAHVEKTE